MASRPKRRRIQTLEDPQINETETLREIEEEIFLDYCHEDRCPHMETELEHLTDNFNPVKKVTDWIKENTMCICLLCIINLIFMGPKFIISWASIGVTMLQEGVAGVLAIFYVFCCSSKISSKHILRKGRQKRKTKDHPLYKINEEHKGT